jgi:DNA-binding transcriptional LysR family regulator
MMLPVVQLPFSLACIREIGSIGSFKEAANKLSLTQSTISARVKTLEEAVGKRLLERSKVGVQLTPSGKHFYRHAVALVRVWRHALLEVAMSDQHTDHLAIGAQISLWEGFLLPWVAWMRDIHTDIAITASIGSSLDSMDRLTEGTIDLAIVYRATSRPDHAEAYPDLLHSGLHLEVGAIGVNYLFDTNASGCFPLRVAQPYIEAGHIRLVPRARRLVYPVYAVYPEDRDEGSYDPILESLRQTVEETFGALAPSS